jgi:hypothetical protein
LLPRIVNIELAHEQDEFYWTLHPNGKFSVKSHYQALLHTDILNINRLIWKVKAPLKIKIFLWYLRRGVILTKDNLVKRNWQGSKTCCFFHKEETIKHLFFDCRFACSIWSFIQVVTGLLKPHNIGHMFNGCLRGVNKDVKLLLLLGGAVTCWSIWLSRNDIVFEKKKVVYPVQVIYLVTHWLLTWAILQKPDLQDTVVAVSQQLTLVAKDFFSPRHMGGGLVYELIVTRLCKIFSLSLWLCASC